MKFEIRWASDSSCYTRKEIHTLEALMEYIDESDDVDRHAVIIEPLSDSGPRDILVIDDYVEWLP